MAHMKRRNDGESGLIPLLILIFLVILAVMVLTFMRVKSVQG